MSDLGYTNNPAQSALLPSYDTLDGYLDVLAKAVSEPYPAYEAMGTQRDGEWVQINTNVLQIENEFYSTIRPKRVTQPGERPLHALSSRGVQYIEVRCLDIDPFEPTGISLETTRFMDAYLLYCALEDSPLLPRAANEEANENFARITKEGRKPGLTLARDGREVPMQGWADSLLDAIEPVAQALDALHGIDEHMTRLEGPARAIGRCLADTVRPRAADHARAASKLQRICAGTQRKACRLFPRPSAQRRRRARNGGACCKVAGRSGKNRA